MAASADIERQSAGLSSEFANLVEQVTARLQSGEAVDLERLCRDHPEHEAALKQLLPALRALAELSASASRGAPLGAAAPTAGPSGTLGDFRILRELGRGGMGVVYEAEQLSLGRRVALKILPFASVLDPRALQRFKNEAQAAAHLDHPHIVDVISVGCERGVHYYAMRFIDGITLSQVIEELKASRSKVDRDRVAGGQDLPLPPGEGRGEGAENQQRRSAPIDKGKSTIPDEAPPRPYLDAATEAYREGEQGSALREPAIQNPKSKITIVRCRRRASPLLTAGDRTSIIAPLPGWRFRHPRRSTTPMSWA